MNLPITEFDKLISVLKERYPTLAVDRAVNHCGGFILIHHNKKCIDVEFNPNFGFGISEIKDDEPLVFGEDHQFFFKEKETRFFQAQELINRLLG